MTEKRQDNQEGSVDSSGDPRIETVAQRGLRVRSAFARETCDWVC